MKIAVLSDIHDHVWNLAVALGAVSGCEALICCGDLCSPFVIDQLARGFNGPIHIVFGNNDADLYRITNKAATRYANVKLRGEFFEEEFDGRRIAVQHFDNIALAIAAGARHDAVFYGHNHRFDIRHFGSTLAFNPGSIMGAQFDADANRADVAPTFGVYDTASAEVQGFRIEAGLALVI